MWLETKCHKKETSKWMAIVLEEMAIYMANGKKNGWKQMQFLE